MRSLTIVLVLGVLTACATSSNYFEYKPAHWRGLNWAITGKAEIGTDADTVIIKINDHDVIFGDLTKQKPEDTFVGTYEGYDVSAKCKLLDSGDVNARHKCSIVIGEDDAKDDAGKLTF